MLFLYMAIVMFQTREMYCHACAHLLGELTDDENELLDAEEEREEFERERLKARKRKHRQETIEEVKEGTAQFAQRQVSHVSSATRSAVGGMRDLVLNTLCGGDVFLMWILVGVVSALTLIVGGFVLYNIFG